MEPTRGESRAQWGRVGGVCTEHVTAAKMFSKLDENYKPTEPRNSVNAKLQNMEKLHQSTA